MRALRFLGALEALAGALEAQGVLVARRVFEALGALVVLADLNTLKALESWMP